MRKYETTTTEVKDIDNAFSHHAPFDDQSERYTAVRAAMRRAALDVMALCPPSPERVSALHHLRLAMFLANAAIACNEVPPL